MTNRLTDIAAELATTRNMIAYWENRLLRLQVAAEEIARGVQVQLDQLADAPAAIAPVPPPPPEPTPQPPPPPAPRRVRHDTRKTLVDVVLPQLNGEPWPHARAWKLLRGIYPDVTKQAYYAAIHALRASGVVELLETGYLRTRQANSPQSATPHPDQT
jgi:hypothetical protein